MRAQALLIVPLLCALAIPAWAQHPSPTPGAPQEIPVQLVAGRFYARPVTTTGDTLTLFTDTGGGLFLTAPTVARLHLPRTFKMAQGNDSIFATRLPSFQPGLGIPDPLGRQGEAFAVGEFDVMPAPKGPAARRPSPWGSGMLGTPWFADWVWTLDYPHARLQWRAPGDVPAVGSDHVTSLYFRTDSAGLREANFPRIRVVVDGDTLDMLLDTGATAVIPGPALAALHDGGPALRATSFITTAVYRRWRKRHPTWRVIPRADQVPGMAMIEVPQVEIGGYAVGPVWFTQRPDAAFHDFMAQFTDRPLDGAIGGSAFGTLRITLDYPGGKAYFERP